MKSVQINSNIMKSIETALSKGDRVELVPLKNHVKIVHIKREEIANIEKDYKGESL